MVLTTMTKRIFPLSGLGPLTKEYTLSSDYDDRWRTGGLEVPPLPYTPLFSHLHRHLHHHHLHHVLYHL